MIQFIKNLFVRKITFIASDFNSLELTLRETDQFHSVTDCPVVRAANRQGIKKYKYNNYKGSSIFYDFDRLELIRERLLAGETSVTVKIWE